MLRTSLPILAASKHPDESKDVSSQAPSLQPTDVEDVSLAQRIECALHGAGYRVLRDIEVRVEARAVRLVGCVPSYFLKQIAQVRAGAVPGAHPIHNDLAVVPQS